MKTMCTVLLGLFFFIATTALAETPRTVHLFIDDGANLDGLDQGSMAIETDEPLMGDELPRRIEISVGEGNAESVLATPMAGSFSIAPQQTTSGVLVVVGAKLQPEKGVSDQRLFKSLEKPVIERHEGKVLISLATSPSEQWPFDIVELVSFPSLDHYQALMNDPAYAPDTALGNAMMTTYTQDLSVAVATLK